MTLLRGTPLLVQLYPVYFGLATVLDLNDFCFPESLPCQVNTTAYIFEIVSVVKFNRWIKGQMRPARSMRMPKRWRCVKLLPQAMKNILPAIGNEFATLIKKHPSSLCGIHDLMYNSGYGSLGQPLPYLFHC